MMCGGVDGCCRVCGVVFVGCTGGFVGVGGCCVVGVVVCGIYDGGDGYGGVGGDGLW